MEKKDVKEFAEKLCRENGGHKLLYLTMVGSHLYGTQNENSDEDYRFIFLPRPSYLLSGKNIKHITYSSGDMSSKNSYEDIDIQGWSFQYFCELLAKGDTNAVDLLFSHTNKSAVLYQKRIMKKVWKNWKKFFNPKGAKSLLGFADTQAKKYGFKGKRMQLVKELSEDKVLNNEENQESKLKYFFGYIKETYETYNNLKFKTDSKGNEFVIINGSEHLESIKVSEFMNRMKREYNKYGKRSESAMENDGYDYKAISHSIRCYIQYRSLLNNGKINFPFKGSELQLIKEVKEKKRNGLEYLEYLSDISEGFSLHKIGNEYDPDFVSNFIVYKLYPFFIY